MVVQLQIVPQSHRFLRTEGTKLGTAKSTSMETQIAANKPAIQPDETTTVEPVRPNPGEAQAMIDRLASVGVPEIDLTLLDHQGGKPTYEHLVSDTLRRLIPKALAWAARSQRSVIVRPVALVDIVLIQLDDLTGDMMDHLKLLAFLALETSPSNFQTWVAIPSTEYDADFRSRLCVGTGADAGASGAVRVAGSINFKTKRPKLPPCPTRPHRAWPNRQPSRA